MKKWIILFLVLATAGSLIAASIAIRHAADADRQVELMKVNADALRDTVRTFRDDSTATATLMATQAQLNADSVANLLGSLRAAVDDRDEALSSLSVMRTEFARLREEFVSHTVTVPDEPTEPGEARADFDVQGPPVEGTVSVVYRPTAPWSLFTDLSVSPFTQVYTIGCDDLHRAVVNVTTPEWVRVNLERGIVPDDYCLPRTRPLFGFSFDKAVWGAAGAVLGAVGFWILDEAFSSDDASGRWKEYPRE